MILCVDVTCADMAEARRIAAALLERRLIACANISEVTSLFRWEGRVADEAEVLLHLKTRIALAEDVEAAVRGLHSYDVPMIARFEVTANADYEDWVRTETGG